MGLKKSVVIVNEYTIKTPDGGTRGGTPGDYVLRYMARGDAIETLSPIRLNAEDTMRRYDARNLLSMRSDSVSDMKSEFRSLQGKGGIAFGYGRFSLSDQELKQAAKDIRDNFNKGKTVLKTVLSFDEDYLRKHKIIDDDFSLVNAGDYRGNIDQMKLRMAIMNGLNKLSRNYDDLQYIGVIQVDTHHVHCHLAMFDRGEGHIMPDGTQRGKLTDKDKSVIRRGIDQFLDEKQTVKKMVSNVDQDRHNTACFVKRYTHKVMRERGFAQFLLACLPEDRNLWRASTNRKEMQKPNAIVRSYVNDILQQPDSGYTEAMNSVRSYVMNRMKTENLTRQQSQQLFENGRNRIVERSMNSVYAVLKQIPDSEFTVDTRMMSLMSMDYTDMADMADSDDKLIDFGFRLRSYKSRLDHHKSEMHKYHDAVEEFKRRESDESALVLYDYFKIEEEYNAMLMTKYQYFLDFIPSDAEYKEDFDFLISYHDRLENLDQMQNDPTITRLSPDNAEAYGKRVYNESGGYYIITKPDVFDNKVADMHRYYDEFRDNFKLKLMDHGLRLSDSNTVQHEKAYAFDDVKALDMHHLVYDFPDDIDISVMNADNFIAMADRRYDAFQKAKTYLINTDQADALARLPEADIELQHTLAGELQTGSSFKTLRSVVENNDVSIKKTIRLDSSYYKSQENDIKNMIRSTIESLQYE